MEMYVEGVSTRKVKEITEELCGTSFSKSLVSSLAGGLDSELSAWRSRRLEAESYPYLFVDARYVILLVQHVGVAKADAAFIRLLERGEDAHQRRLAGTVRTEQAVHSRRNREGHVLQRLHAVEIGLRYVADV